MLMGHEAAVLCATSRGDWETLDAIVEVGNQQNAVKIYDHFRKIDVGLFAQKTGWQKVEKSEDMPTSHRDGSLFISVSDSMPWP